MNRRRALTVIGTVTVTGLAGCVGGEDGTISGSASAAEIPDGDREGYEADGPEKIALNETIEVSGVSRDVDLQMWSAAYAKTENQTGVFLVSTPDVKVAGVSANPLTRLSGADLITRVADEGLARTDTDLDVKEIEKEEETNIDVLGEERTVSVFSALLDLGESDGSGEIEGSEGGEVPILLYVISMTHEEDVLLSVGFHPEPVEAREEITSMMGAIEHPVEAESDSATNISE